MKNCKIIPNKGYYLSGLNKSFYDIALDLICNQTAIFGLDNTVKMYTLLNGKIKSSELHPQKEYMKVIAKFEMPEEANTTFKKYNIYNSMELYTQEQDIWLDVNYHIDLFLLPFMVKIDNEDILIYPIMKFYHNNILIINYNIYCYDPIKKKKFERIYADINRKTFQKISIPINYAPKGNEYEEVESIMDEEKTRYVEVEAKNEFSNIIYFSKYLISLIGDSEWTGVFYGRCTYLIDNTENNVDEKFIDTLLKGAKGDYVSEAKDYSYNKSYKRYCNERATIVVGKKAIEQESLVQAVEEMMIIQTIDDTILFYNLRKNEYTYKELKSIYNNMLYYEIDKRVSNYGEIENMLAIQHSFMNRDKKIEYLRTCIDVEIKEKETFYQDKISLFALLLSAGPIVDYIFFPLLNNILHLEKIYKYIIILKNSNLKFLINTDILKMCCFIIALVGIYWAHKKFIKGKL